MNLAKINTAGLISQATRDLAMVAIAVSLCCMQTAVAEDFASIFDQSYQGVALDITHLGERVSFDQSNELNVQATALPGFPLSQEELLLVLKAADPIGIAAGPSGDMVTGGPVANPVKAAQEPRPLRIRLIDWIKRDSGRANVFSALARDKTEPGMRLDIDPETEKVVVEYRIGF